MKFLDANPFVYAYYKPGDALTEIMFKYDSGHSSSEPADPKCP
jgi:hypothetical protein